MRTIRLRRLAIVFLVVARLFQLQILEHEKWSEDARNGRTGRNSIPFRRGQILDRNDVVLARDRQAFELFFRYRDFRRGFVAAQLFEALKILGHQTDGLVDCLDRGEELGSLCLGLRPQDLEGVKRKQRDDLLFYLTAMTGDRSFARRVAVQEWDSEGQQSFASAFPGVADDFKQRLVDARHDLQFLEHLLRSEQPEPLLERLEDRRRQLEVIVLRAALQEAAARVFDITPSRLRSELVSNLESRDEWLQELHERWQLDGGLAHFGVVLAPLSSKSIAEGSADALATNDFQQLDAVEQAAVINAVIKHLEVVAPDDVSGTVRKQTGRIHRLRVNRLERGLSFDLVDLLSQQAGDFPGLYLQQVTHRLYPQEVARMLVGSLRLPRESDMDANHQQRERYEDLRGQLHRTAAEEAEFRQLRDWWWSESLAANEHQGQDGIEKVYEPVLRGSRGYLQELEGGADGELPLELLFSPPENGADIKLALDAGMIAAVRRVIPEVYAGTRQRLENNQPANLAKAMAQFQPTNQKVGFVILDVETGEVPVLVSTPDVTRSEWQRDYEDLIKLSDGTPLRNRAMGGGFSGKEQPYPGSTFKPLVAAAALAIDPGYWRQRYICEGFYTAPGTTRAIKCDTKYGHHEIEMREALKRSCNVYFYQLGNEIGAAPIHALASDLGFGAKIGKNDDTHAGTGNELSLSTSLELHANYLQELSVLERDTMERMRTSIGQVGVRASPLQMARLFGWLATGRLVRPQFVLEGGGASPAREALPQPSISIQTRTRIADALAAVVYEQNGTASRTEFPAEWQIVGKTGTAEIGGDIPTHAWFTGYFPADNPRYAFAVLCENTGLHGGQIASYILKEFLQTEEGSALLR